MLASGEQVCKLFTGMATNMPTDNNKPYLIPHPFTFNKIFKVALNLLLKQMAIYLTVLCFLLKCLQLACLDPVRRS